MKKESRTRSMVFLAMLLIGFAGRAVAQPLDATEELKPTLYDLRDKTQTKQWQEILDISGRWRDKYPNHPDLILFEAGALHGLERYPESIVRSKTFLERFPESGRRDQALYLLGDSLQRTGSPEEAAPVLEQASRTTQDPSLRIKVAEMLKRPAAPAGRVGISLGGKPPQDAADLERAREVSKQILILAVQAYKNRNGSLPDRIEQLLRGDPPTLKSLPEDPARAGKPIPLEDALQSMGQAPPFQTAP